MDVVRGGHNLMSPGASALIDEVTEDRLVKDAIIKWRKIDNTPITDVTPGKCDVNSDLNYGVKLANSLHADMYSIHFNKAYNTYAGAIGSEIWCNPNNPKAVVIANRILANLHGLGFINRGIKDGISDLNGGQRLYEITRTDNTSMIIEVCFVEATDDVRIYKTIGFDIIGKAIAEGIVGHTINAPIIDSKPLNVNSFVVTNYLPQGGYGIEIRALESKYFQGVDRLYVRNNVKGMWIETQYLSQAKCDEIASKLKVDNLFYAIQK